MVIQNTSMYFAQLRKKGSHYSLPSHKANFFSRFLKHSIKGYNFVVSSEDG